MLILNKYSKLATIVEVGEDEIVLSCLDKEYTVPLDDNNKDTVFNMLMDERGFTVAFDPYSKQLLLGTHKAVKEENLYELSVL